MFRDKHIFIKVFSAQINLKINFLKFSPGNLLIIFYQLTIIIAASYNNLRYLDYKFPMPEFAMGNNKKRKKNFFLNFDQVIYSLSFIS